MDIAAPGFHSESKNDTFPLLMELPESINSGDHVIDITRNGDSLPSSSAHSRPSSGLNTSRQDRPANNARATMPLPLIPSSNVSTSRNSSFLRRGETRRRRSPLNSGLWISIELVLTIGQIVASVVVLSLSRHERPRTPLFAWVVGYASGCVATLPLLYWRYRHHSQLPEQDIAQPRQGSQINVSAVPFSLSVSRTPEGEDRRRGASSSESRQGSEIMNARLKALVEYFKMALDCFFAIWFVVGNVWIFGGHSSADQAPNLYRLCIVFLTFSCIGYAMPFILCATICCCLPCIISALGFREDLTQNQGATSESIDALPTYKFKIKKIRNGDDRDGVFDGGVIAAGTDKERVISGEDAVCCICLAKYVNNDELRELPCFHFFHKECVDKWLKISASCPLCKSEVGESPLMGSLSGANAGRPNNDF